jgi:hypothetical protein
MPVTALDTGIDAGLEVSLKLLSQGLDAKSCIDVCIVRLARRGDKVRHGVVSTLYFLRLHS